MRVRVTGYGDGRSCEREMTIVPSVDDAIDTPAGIARVSWRRFFEDHVQLHVRLLPAWPPADLDAFQELAKAMPVGKASPFPGSVLTRREEG